MNKIKSITSCLILLMISSCNSQESNNRGLFEIANSINQLSESVEKLSKQKDNVLINTNDEFLYSELPTHSLGLMSGLPASLRV